MPVPYQARALLYLVSVVRATVAGGPKMIGYFDANAQKELAAHDVPHENLTHLVLTNGFKVDNQGELHLHVQHDPWDLGVDELMAELASRRTKLIIGLRGFPDDVAFDELAEVPERRAAFAQRIAARLL